MKNWISLTDLTNLNIFNCNKKFQQEPDKRDMKPCFDCATAACFLAKSHNRGINKWMVCVQINIEFRWLENEATRQKRTRENLSSAGFRFWRGASKSLSTELRQPFHVLAHKYNPFCSHNCDSKSCWKVSSDISRKVNKLGFRILANELSTRHEFTLTSC